MFSKSVMLAKQPVDAYDESTGCYGDLETQKWHLLLQYSNS